MLVFVCVCMCVCVCACVCAECASVHNGVCVCVCTKDDQEGVCVCMVPELCLKTVPRHRPESKHMCPHGTK